MTNNLAQVKAQFQAEGISIAEWARTQGFNPKLVYRVLNGSVQGTRGQAHAIACRLGLKTLPENRRLRHQMAVA